MEPIPLTAIRGTTNDAEAELVLIDHQGDNVTLTLDDGETLTFARTELHSATRRQPATLADAA